MTVPGTGWPLLTAACICLFIGAMGKSAQFPLHVWLPDSMEGPTPISALIHAATMVTAGIFMVSRMSPLFELSDTALSFVIVIGSITALFMGFLGIIQNDIKRVVAYSTLSQLGYMTVALGASAYNVAVFHLMTHAFFKALLFLGAGSVIIGMHHDQDMRNMGGLRKYMPITWITSLLGSLALIGTPFFSGFYSKDSIIEAVARDRTCWGAGFAYFAVHAPACSSPPSTRSACTSWCSTAKSVSARRMRMTTMRTHTTPTTQAMAAHGHDAHALHDADAHHEEEDDDHGHHGLAPGQKPHESPLVVTLPLILLAIPSVIIGFFDDRPDAVRRLLQERDHDRRERTRRWKSWRRSSTAPARWACTRFTSLPFMAGAGRRRRGLLLLHDQSARAGLVFYKALRPIHTLLDNKYYMDKFNDVVFAGGARLLGKGLWQVGDRGLIDGLIVNGSAKLVGWFSTVVRTVPDWLHLPLCVRDDPGRAGYAAVLLPVLARLRHERKTRCSLRFHFPPYLSLSIWLPILFGVHRAGHRP